MSDCPEDKPGPEIRGWRSPGTTAPRRRPPAGAARRPPLPISAAPAPSRRGRGLPATVARVDVRKTYKLYVGGAFPRSESGRSYPATAARAASCLPMRRWRRGRTRGTRWWPPAAAAGKWAGATAYNRGQVLYRVAEMIEGRAGAVRRRRSLTLKGFPRQRPGGQSSRDRPVGLVRGLAGQGRAGRRRRQPGRRTVLQLQRARADRGRRGHRASRVQPARAGQRARAGDRDREHGGGRRERGPRRCPAITLAEVLATSDVPRRRGEPADRPHRRARAGAGRPLRRERDRPDRGGRGRPGRAGAAGRGNVKRVFAPDDDWAAAPAPRRMLAFLETKTVWHPVGI